MINLIQDTLRNKFICNMRKTLFSIGNNVTTTTNNIVMCFPNSKVNVNLFLIPVLESQFKRSLTINKLGNKRDI
jgi:hypothetical protein